MVPIGPARRGQGRIRPGEPVPLEPEHPSSSPSREGRAGVTALRVLIVGAGIAGLALARALCQRGIIAEVVERTTDWEPSGTGLYLPANAVRALHELGIGAGRHRPREPDRAAAPPQPPRASSRRHRRRPNRGTASAAASRSIARRYRGASEATAEVPVRLGTSVTDLEIGGAPQVTFSDGSTGSYDLVVGADGVHSTIRSLALGGPPANYVGTGVLAIRRRRLLRHHRLDGHAGPRTQRSSPSRSARGSCTATPTSTRTIRPLLRSEDWRRVVRRLRRTGATSA